MAWDDDKGPGDGLPSSEWDAMVADQKSRAPITVSGTEPAVGPEGAIWIELVDAITLQYGTSSYVLYGKSPIPDASGNLWAVDEYDKLVGYDPDTDTELLSTDLPDFSNGMGVGQNNIFIGGFFEAFAYDKTDGTEVWQINAENRFGSGGVEAFTADDSNNRAFMSASDEEQVNAIDASTGSSDWSYRKNNTETIEFLSYDPERGVVYFGTGGGIFGELPESGSSPNWRKTNGTSSIKRMVSDGSYLYVMYGSTIVKIDPTDGSEIWSVTDSVWNDIGLLGQSLYALNGPSTTLEKIDTSNGSVTVSDINIPNVDDTDITSITSYRQNIYASTAFAEYVETTKYSQYVSNGNIWMSEK